MISQSLFTSLADIPSKVSSHVNILAVIRDCAVRGRSRTGDYMLSVSVVDPTSQTPLSINMFAKSSCELPARVEAGQIARLMQIKIQTFNGRPQGLTSFRSDVRVLQPSEIGDAKNDVFADAAEVECAQQLVEWWNVRNSGAVAFGSSKRRIRTLDSLREPHECFDFYCQVIHVENDTGDRTVLLVSDFTTLSFNNGIDPISENPSYLYPIPKLLLRLTVWTNMDSNQLPIYVRIARGNFIFVRNAFTKSAIGYDGTPTCIEAVLHSSREMRDTGGRWSFVERESDEVEQIRRRLKDLGLEKRRANGTFTGVADLRKFKLMANNIGRNSNGDATDDAF
ncbi:hypothetical protein HDU82_004092 [Entophlyctis luteolus]|nr:hypothetical protein HDU82_004092 [Entophlyctis luteolus]